MPVYTETQQSKYRWLLYGFAFVCQFAALLYVLQLVELFSLGVKIAILVSSSLIFLMLFGLFLFQRLDTRIDEKGVHFRAPLSWAKWQHIGWPDIDQIYVREYALLGEYPKGIMGLRQGPNGFAIAPQ